MKYLQIESNHIDSVSHLNMFLMVVVMVIYAIWGLGE